MRVASMLSRFEGDDGRRRLTDLIRSQLIVGGDAGVASEIAAIATLHELAVTAVLVHQEAPDNDLYLILSGAVRIVVNGRDVAFRKAGEHVGEMAIIDPASPRTATVIAAEPSIVAKVTDAELVRIATSYPSLWRAMALQLCRRLNERKRFHGEPNAKPVIFIGSSKEQLHIAKAIADAVPAHTADIRIWSIGVFEASSFPIDDLDAQLRTADFAVLVGAADDQVTSRGIKSDAPRDNVIFELGLFMGALSRFRTFLAIPKGTTVKIPSDLLGLNHIVYDGGATDPAVAVKAAVAELIEVVAKKGPK